MGAIGSGGVIPGGGICFLGGKHRGYYKHRHTTFAFLSHRGGSAGESNGVPFCPHNPSMITPARAARCPPPTHTGRGRRGCRRGWAAAPPGRCGRPAGPAGWAAVGPPPPHCTAGCGSAPADRGGGGVPLHSVQAGCRPSLGHLLRFYWRRFSNSPILGV